MWICVCLTLLLAAATVHVHAAGPRPEAPSDPPANQSAPSSSPSQDDAQTTLESYRNNPAAVARPVRKRPRAARYEEALGGPFEEGVKRIDYALLRTLQLFGYDQHRMHLETVEPADAGEGGHLRQTMRLRLDEPPRRFLEGLRQALRDWVEGATLAPLESAAPGVEGWRVILQGRETHRLLFVLQGMAEHTSPPPPSTDRPLLAIVIDDLGESAAFARNLASLGEPITFAIWPLASHVESVTAVAVETGMEIIVHQPMEPMAYPEMNPGPGAVYVDMDDQAIRATVLENLQRVPNAVGLNNHMGSRFTQNARGVAAVAEVLRTQRLFALDSLTHPQSTFRKTAQAQGVPSLVRDVFLDVVRSEQAVAHQLRKAERIAQGKGFAIAIGHPFPETLAGLRRWLASRDPRVRVVTLRELLVASGQTPPAAADHALKGAVGAKAARPGAFTAPSASFPSSTSSTPSRTGRDEEASRAAH